MPHTDTDIDNCTKRMVPSNELISVRLIPTERRVSWNEMTSVRLIHTERRVSWNEMISVRLIPTEWRVSWNEMTSVYFIEEVVPSIFRRTSKHTTDTWCTTDSVERIATHTATRTATHNATSTATRDIPTRISTHANMPSMARGVQFERISTQDPTQHKMQNGRFHNFCQIIHQLYDNIW